MSLIMVASHQAAREEKSLQLCLKILYTDQSEIVALSASQIFVNESLRELFFRPVEEPRSECWGYNMGRFGKQLINATSKISLESTHFSLLCWSQPPSSFTWLTAVASLLVSLLPLLLLPIYSSFGSQRDILKI